MSLGSSGELPASAGTPPARSAEDVFDRYERQFAEARLRLPERNPAEPAHREAIARVAKDCLGIRDEWIPQIEAAKVREAAFDGGRIELLRATSWPGVTATALLYVPADAGSGPLPLVILCCGHGQGGKLS